jgi:hypothetical protein
VTEAELEFTYHATERLRVHGGGSVAEVEEVGVPYHMTELEDYADIRWALRQHLNLVLEGWVTREERHDDPEESFDRAMIRAGLEAVF